MYNGEPVIYKDIRYEQACVLYNIGSLYAQLASRETRQTDEVSRFFYVIIIIIITITIIIIINIYSG